jgi:two-component system, NtrC family, sensor kinase
VETGRQQQDFTNQDLEDVQTLMEPTAAQRGVDLKFVVDLPQTLLVPAGPLRQVLINMLNNAVEAASEGGWVQCEVGLAGSELRLDVTNSGDPIPPERLGHLFEPFVSYREGGHGLGLWVTYQLVHQLSGRIEVACEEQTVRFTVTVPIDKQEAQAA